MKVSLRFEVLKRDRFTCIYCGRTPPHVLLEVDHVVPKSAGGKDEIDNLITSCADCNRGKGAKLLEEGLAGAIGNRSVEELRERLEQARAYAELQAEVEQFVSDQLEQVWKLWCEGFHGTSADGFYRVDYGFPAESRVRDTLKQLPLEEVLDAIRITVDKFGGRPKYKSSIPYFWAVVRNRIADARGEPRP